MEKLHATNEMIVQFLILLSIGVVSWLVADKLKKPYTIVLVMIGLLVALFVPFHFMEEVTSTFTKNETFSTIVLSLFLPALLGEASMKLKASELRAFKSEILRLSLVGTFLTFGIISLLLFYVCGLPMIVSCTIASLMCATDPISVMGIFKTMNVKENITISMEGESLFNDGVGVVLFKISTVFLVSYLQMGIAGVGSGLFLFLKVVLIGSFVGLIAGYIASKTISLTEEYPLETMVSLLLFYGSYLVAEHFHGSGVIAVVVSGFVFGNYGKKIGMNQETHKYIYSFWDVMAFIGNTVLFLLIGLEVERLDFSTHFWLILSSILIVLVARTIAVHVSLIGNKTFSFAEKNLMNWGGLKGALSISLALTLPHNFPYREDILLIVFVNVLFSLLVQGLTIPAYIRRFKI